MVLLFIIVSMSSKKVTFRVMGHICRFECFVDFTKLKTFAEDKQCVDQFMNSVCDRVET